MSFPARRNDRLLPWFLAAGLLIVFGLGWVALIDPDEGRYASAARGMLRTGDPIVPTFNGAPRLNKPPLLNWLQAASMGLLGESDAAARVPSALAALATLGMVAWFARRRLAPHAAPGAIIVLATTPIFFAAARLAITDALLTCWVALTLVCWHEAIGEKRTPHRRALARAAAVACGLAVLTKGPVGFVLPAIVIVTVSTVDRLRGRRDPLPSPRGAITWKGIALAIVGILLVAGPWLAGLAGRIGIGPIVDIVMHETLARAGPGLDHPRPTWYLLATFWPLFAPWSILAPLAIARALRQGNDPGRVTAGRQQEPSADSGGLHDRRRGEGKGPSTRSAPIESRANSTGVAPEQQRVERFLIVWVVCVLVFFSLLADKNDAWLLPAAPPMALLVASRIGRRSTRICATVTAILLAGAVHLGHEAISSKRSLRGVVEAARLDREGRQYTLLGYRIERPSLVWYAQRDAVWLRSGAELEAALAAIPPRHPVAIVMTRARRGRMSDAQRDLLSEFEIIADKDGYFVFFRSP